MIKRSPWVAFFGSGTCNGCDLEIIAALTPRYDIERLGCVLKPSARHADILIVTGAITRQGAERLKTVYRQMADKKVVIAFGSCGISGESFSESYNFAGPVDKVIPVDIYLPGCPPRPEAIIDGILKAVGVLNES